MKRICLCLLSVVLSCFMFGCQPDDDPSMTASIDGDTTLPSVQPSPESTGNLVNLPVESSEAPVVSTDAPLTYEETVQSRALWASQNAASSLSAFYTWYGEPMLYPVTDDTLNTLRDFAQRTADGRYGIMFDEFSIEPTDWGFSINVVSPEDFWGRPYMAWFEVSPSNTEQLRMTLVSAGEDGRFTYKGMGHDYSFGGFGDDLVSFINQ